MSYIEEKDQRFLFAVDFHGCGNVIAVKGRAAQVEIENYSSCVGDLFYSDDLKTLCPHPGLYVWEGSLCIEPGGWCGSEPIEPDIEWDGDVRPATFADLCAFGASTIATMPFLIVPKPKEIELCTSSSAKTSGSPNSASPTPS